MSLGWEVRVFVRVFLWIGGWELSFPVVSLGSVRDLGHEDMVFGWIEVRVSGGGECLV